MRCVRLHAIRNRCRMKARATISLDDEVRQDTVYNVVIKHDASGQFLEWLDWQVEAREPKAAVAKVLLILAADPEWAIEIDNVAVACVPLRNFRFHRGAIEERPPKLVIK